MVPQVLRGGVLWHGVARGGGQMERAGARLS